MPSPHASTVRIVLALLLNALLSTVLLAQAPVPSPGYSQRPLGSGIFINGQVSDIAVDAGGNVFIVEGPGLTLAPPILHRVSAAGVNTVNYATQLAGPVSLAFRSADGAAYALSRDPLASGQRSILWRLDAAAPTRVTTVDLVCDDFAIDDSDIFFGAGLSAAGSGLHVFALGGGAALVVPSRDSFSSLTTLADGSVLLADRTTVRRYDNVSPTLSPFFTASVLPNEFNTPISVARRPFNAMGAGAIVGFRNFSTFCFCGTVSLYATDFGGGSTSTTPVFASAPYAPPQPGETRFCTSRDRSLIEATTISGFAGNQVLFSVIEGVPAPGSHGSLFVSGGLQGRIDIELYGASSGNDPFLLGFVPIIGGNIPAPAYLPGYGPIALDPFGVNYMPALDGIGLLGPAAPFARTDASGVFRFSAPAGGFGFSVYAQAILLDGSAAPNGLFTLSNPVTALLP